MRSAPASPLRPHALVIALLLLLQLPGTSAFFGEWGPDLEGPWCATRGPGQDCCYGRDDDCGVPILGTVCYCDIFCNDTAYDCCPDYWPHCHGLDRTTPAPTTLPPPRSTRPPPGTCLRNGREYLAGETIQDNCNNCTCQLEPLTGQYVMTCTQEVCLVRPYLIEDVNDGPFTWKAKNYSKFWGMTLDQGIRYRLGTFVPQEDVLKMYPLRVKDDVLPEQFDANEKWPNLVHPVRDQGNCASSWAHSTTAVASDRLSIETNGEIKDELSAQHLLSCDQDGQKGCQGGHLDRAWWYLRKSGVVTEQCYPYTSGETDEPGQCLVKKKSDQCPTGVRYKTNKRYKATPPYRIRPLEREIMKEIMDNGPVQATFRVRDDFFLYSRGIYSYSGLGAGLGQPLQFQNTSDYHSVRIMGWGAERNPEGDIIKYWLCANSWGTDWGENGYFRIRRGTDESKVESYVVGAWGRISGDSTLKALLKQRRRDRRMRLQAGRSRRHLRQLRTSRERRWRRRHNMAAASRRRDARRHGTHRNSRRQRTRRQRNRRQRGGKKKMSRRNRANRRHSPKKTTADEIHGGRASALKKALNELNWKALTASKSSKQGAKEYRDRPRYQQ